jgi:hypothetical protein
MSTTKQLTWTDTYGFTQIQVIDPDSTKVKAVVEGGRKLMEAHAAHAQLARERTAAQGDVQRRTDEARAEARAAGRDGKPFDGKKSRKRTRELEERLAEIDLEWEHACAVLRGRSSDYLQQLEHHAPALAAEAKGEADAAILSLASASAIARRAEAGITGSLAILDALQRVQAGDGFKPRPPKARREVADEFGSGAAPGPYVGVAVEKLGTAIGLATRILDDLKAAEAEAAKAAKAEAVADNDPNEIPYTDEEDENEDDDE